MTKEEALQIAHKEGYVCCSAMSATLVSELVREELCRFWPIVNRVGGVVVEMDHTRLVILPGGYDWLAAKEGNA